MRRTAVIIMSMLTIVCVLAGCSQKSSTSDNELYKGKTVSVSVMGGSDGQDFQGEPPEMPEGQEKGQENGSV